MELERFKIDKTLGVGATSEVFRAENISQGTKVALKMFNPVVLSDEEALSRLSLEIDALRRIKHPNIVRLISEIREKNQFGLELELVEGSDLKKWKSGYDTPLMEPIFWVLSQVARGLGAAHEREVLHRDLKPENILISDSGEVKITDFGLARQLDRLTVTRLGLLTGSLGFMAPEVINGEKATPQSDIFSFGIIAYELLAGVSPFKGETPQAIIRSIISDKAQRLQEKTPWVPALICQIIDQCLEKDPKKRPSSIWHVEAELLSHLSKTRMISFCQDMVGTKSRYAKLSQALRLKHDLLKEQLAQKFDNIEKNPSKEDRRELVYLLAEMSRVFPDDKEREKYLLTYSALNSEPESRSKLIVLVALVLVGWVGVSVYLYFSGRLVQQVEVPPVKIESVPIVVAPEVKVEKAVVKVGALSFVAESDVTIFVNGILVPKAKWKKYSLSPGPKTIKLVKEGFEPIENAVVVESGKTTVINTLE